MKFLRKRKILVLIIILLLALGISQRERFFKKPPEPKVTLSPEDAEDTEQEVYTFKVEGFTKERKVQWGLEGESAVVVEDNINIKNLKAKYYGDNMTLNLLADRAIYNKKTQNIELEDNIVGTTTDGAEFMTDRAQWNALTEEITTKSSVVVKRENIICRGKGLTTKPKLKWVLFEEEVDVDFGDDKKITCSGPFELDHEKNIAIFNNDVKVMDKKSTMFTDKLTVFLDPETNEVKRVVTEGNVKVVHKGGIDDLDKIGEM